MEHDNPGKPDSGAPGKKRRGEVRAGAGATAFAQPLRRALARIAKPDIAFYILPALMLLLVAGTLAQRYIGLYDAHRLFFASFVLWAGPVPLPGGYSLITALGVSLLAKFLFFSSWPWRKAGINLAHLGVLTLLFGGLATALTAREGFMIIPEGQHSAVISDYFERELVITRNGMLHAAIPHRKIVAGQNLRVAGVPFTIDVAANCRHCRIIRREEAAAEFGTAPLRGMARFMALVPDKPLQQEEMNLYGAALSLTGAGEDSDGIHIIFDSMPKPIEFSLGEDSYSIIFEKRQRPLPFSIGLEDFVKQTHPGLALARAYHSDVIVIDADTSWPVRIEMNKPLRYKGYTFFQSSFAELGAGEDAETATVLSVVQNSGWIFPYVGTGIIAAGLLLHLMIATGFKSGNAGSAARRQP